MSGLYEYRSGKAGVHPASAIFSPDGRYRYHLRRQLTRDRSCMTFIMLNPSDADERTNDATVRRCVGFAGRERFGTMQIVNLFALVAHNPRRLLESDDPVGPGNTAQIMTVLRSSCWERHLIVVAWGAIPSQHRQLDRQAVFVLGLLDHAQVRVHALGDLTKDGHPRHPLYMPANAPLADVTDVLYIGHPAGDVFYLLACLVCDPPLPMPFSSEAERGKWAATHTRGTGHSRWHVWEDPPGLTVLKELTSKGEAKSDGSR